MVLRYFEDLTEAQVADILGCSTSADAGEEGEVNPMPVSEEQLRQLLERSDPSRERPVPQERIAARIRRARIRRAAGAALLAVAVAADVVTTVDLVHEHAPRNAASYSGRRCPRRSPRPTEPPAADWPSRP